MALLLALAAAPALFNIQSSTSFEPDKAAIIMALAALALIDILWRKALAPAGDSPRFTARLSSITHHPWALLLAGLAIWAVFITLTSIDPVTGLWGNYDRGYGLLIVLAGLVFVGVSWEMARSGRHWLLVDAALLGAVIPIFYGYIQMLDLDPVRGWGISFPLGERASSTLGNPLYLGDYLLIAIILGTARRILQPPATSLARRILEIFLLLALLLLFLTFSRSAYLGLLASGASLLFFLGIQQRRTPKQDAKPLRSPPPPPSGSAFGSKWMAPAGVVALIGGVVLLILLWPRLQHGGTIQQRLLIWQAVIDLLRARPRALLLGLGFDTLPLAIAPYLSPTLAHFEPDFIFRIPDRAHTLPLELLTMGGLPWLLGWLAVGGMALWRLTRGHHPLAPWLAAIIIGRGTLLLFSFPTHIPDLLFWAVLGMSFGLETGRGHDLPSAKNLTLPAIAAFGVFGFSLSASWPGGLILWALTALPLSLLLYALSPVRTLAHLTFRTVIPALLILPAILLNQHIGIAAQLAWLWLLLWFIAQPLLIPWPANWSLPVLQFALTALFILLLAIPRLGDIAYKSALLAPDQSLRDRYLARAIQLAPYDHVMDAGMAWVQAQRLKSATHADPERTQHVTQLYLAAINAQPLAPEPAAGLARWLAHLAETDPSYAAQAQDAFQRALQLSPNDIQTLNDQAMLWAQMGRTEAAIAELQRLLTLDPLYGPTYLNLARVYRQAGDEEAADAIIQQGRENVPWWDAWDEN